MQLPIRKAMNIRLIIRKPALLALLTVTSVACGCSADPPPGRPRPSETYRELLTRLQDDLDLDQNLALHPLLGQATQGPGGFGLRVDSFNPEDTTTVPNLVNTFEDRFHLCTLTPLNACDRVVDKVFVVLSELVEVEEGQFWVAVFLSDNRSPPGTWIQYTASVERRRGAWRVISFRRAS